MADIMPSRLFFPYTKGWCFIVGALAAAEERPLAPAYDPRMVRLVSQRGDHQEFARLVTARQRGYDMGREIRAEIERTERPLRYDLPVKPEGKNFTLPTVKPRRDTPKPKF